MRIAFAVALVALGVTSAAATAATPSALLVVDENNLRVLRVPLGGGPVTVLSPPSGATENLLTSPRGIGTGPDGEIFVANYFEATLVFIDAATGAQFPVEGSLSGPPAIGSLPRDVAVNPREPSPGFFRTVGVAALSELHQVVQSGFSTTGSLLATYPSPYTGWLGRFVSARDPGGDGPIDYFVAIDAVPAILRYRGATDAFTLFYDPDGATIHGLDAPPGNVVTSVREEACPSMENGVLVFDADSASGFRYVADCPGPVAHDADGATTYFVDAGSSPQRVMRIQNGGIAPIADLASATSAIDMALYAPEPAAPLVGAIALLALASGFRRNQAKGESR